MDWGLVLGTRYSVLGTFPVLPFSRSPLPPLLPSPFEDAGPQPPPSIAFLQVLGSTGLVAEIVCCAVVVPPRRPRVESAVRAYWKDHRLPPRSPDESGSVGSASPPVGARKHLLTIALEDYYHTGPFKQLVSQDNWYRFETRLEIGTLRALDLLDQFGAKATFFALGWVADAAPELIRKITDRGHEIATRGYYHRDIAEFSQPSSGTMSPGRGKPSNGHRVNRWWVSARLRAG